MTAGDLSQVMIGVFAGDLMRYVIGAGGIYLLVNVAFASRLLARKIRKSSPDAAQMRREILASLRTVAIFATVGISVVLGANFGVFRIYTDVQDFGWGYLIAVTLATIVIHDTYFYWAHRFMHRPKWFRIFHRLHHRSHNPSPFAAYAFDPGEALANAVFLPLVLLVMPLHPIALLVFTTHMILRNAMGHCGYELFPANRFGKPLLGWMTTVTHHDLHHAYARCNMGLYFTWWDRIMGTEHPEYLAEFARVAPGRLRGRLTQG